MKRLVAAFYGGPIIPCLCDRSGAPTDSNQLTLKCVGNSSNDNVKQMKLFSVIFKLDLLSN
jgi:hypothetical protein